MTRFASSVLLLVLVSGCGPSISTCPTCGAKYAQADNAECPKCALAIAQDRIAEHDEKANSLATERDQGRENDGARRVELESRIEKVREAEMAESATQRKEEVRILRANARPQIEATTIKLAEVARRLAVDPPTKDGFLDDEDSWGHRLWYDARKRTLTSFGPDGDSSSPEATGDDIVVSVPISGQ